LRYLKGDAMGRLIVFNGGTSGGIYIHSYGVQPISPLPPPVLMHLRGVADLLRATYGSPPEEGTSKDLQKLITKVANLAIERVEAAIGPLDGEDSLVYLEDDDGFICGSTGAPPRPIKWPHVSPFSVEDLVQRGFLATDVSELLRRTHAQGLKVADVLEDPVSAAKRVGLQLSDLAIANLQPLAPSQLDKISDPVEHEIVDFFHKVSEDGRFLDRWNREPASVAKALGVELNIAAIDRILGTSVIITRPGDVANLSIEQGIVVGVVAVVLVVLVPDLDSIRDNSGIKKF
jgi:hypothetical protein